MVIHTYMNYDISSIMITHIDNERPEISILSLSLMLHTNFIGRWWASFLRKAQIVTIWLGWAFLIKKRPNKCFSGFNRQDVRRSPPQSQSATSTMIPTAPLSEINEKHTEQFVKKTWRKISSKSFLKKNKIETWGVIKN